MDGVYDRDPKTDANAKRFERITYADALSQRLKVMDSTAFSLCMDNKIPIVVFDMNTPANFTDIVLGKNRHDCLRVIYNDHSDFLIAILTTIRLFRRSRPMQNS